MALRRTRQGGFTLMELMIVVAIVAILAVVAIMAFGRWKKRAIRSEVASVLGAISLRQEAFRAEFSTYKNCDNDAEQSWPRLDTAGGEPKKKAVGTNACWQSLGLSTDPYLYCAYSVYGAAANTWATSIRNEDKAAFGGTVPTTLWYLGIAECDLDGDPTARGTNSIFYRTHQSSTLGERNPDK